MSVHRFLVTADFDHKMAMWSLTAPYANWIEGRDNGPWETWLVTCFAENAGDFLSAARATEVTVEEIQDAGEAENYVFRTGDRAMAWGDHT